MNKLIIRVLSCIFIFSIFCGVNVSALESNKKYEDASCQNEICVAMAADNNYTLPTIVAMTSIMENSLKSNKYRFYLLLSGDFSTENKQKLTSLEHKYINCSVNLIDMNNMYEDYKVSSHITTPTYYRLSLPSLLPNLDKILYLDGDIIVRKDLGELYNTNIDDYYVAGVDQPHTSTISLGRDFLKSVGLTSHDEYINAGIILINLKQWRENNLEVKFQKCKERNANNRKWRLHDQDLLNEVCFDHIYYLPLKYNALMHYYNTFDKLIKPISKNVWESSYEDATIVHFSSKVKPWNDLTISKANLWWDYANKTDFIKDINEKYMGDII